MKRLFSVTSFCQRFVSVIKKEQLPLTVVLAVQEIKNAEMKWIKAVQRPKFNEEFIASKTNLQTRLSKQLDLFIDQDILRCGGRLSNEN